MCPCSVWEEGLLEGFVALIEGAGACRGVRADAAVAVFGVAREIVAV